MGLAWHMEGNHSCKLPTQYLKQFPKFVDSFLPLVISISVHFSLSCKYLHDLGKKAVKLILYSESNSTCGA